MLNLGIRFFVFLSKEKYVYPLFMMFAEIGGYVDLVVTLSMYDFAIVFIYAFEVSYRKLYA